MQQSHEAYSTRIRSYLTTHTRELEILADILRASALLSGRNGETRAEAATALVSLLRVYRDAPTGNAVVCSMEVIRSVQLLFEMMSVSRTKWTVLVLLECAKLIARGLLVWKQSSMLLDKSTHLAVPAVQPSCTCGMRDIVNSHSVNVRRGQRSGKNILSIAPQNGTHNATEQNMQNFFQVAYERRASWLLRALSSDKECEACTVGVSTGHTNHLRTQDTEQIVNGQHQTNNTHQLHTDNPQLRPQQLVGEFLYIARPLIHLLLIRAFGWRSWRAWTASLAVDTTSRALMGAPAATADYKEERRRRNAQMFLYLLRSPLFDFILQCFIRRVEALLRRIPLVGSAASSTIELVVMLQKYWFYTSGS